MRQYYVCAVLPSEPAIIDGTKEIPLFGDDDQPVLDGNGNPVTETVSNVVKQAIPQRAKVHDFRPKVNHAADIPVDPSTGLTVRGWCVVAVDADPGVHGQLSSDPEIWPVGSMPSERQNVQDFLASRGEVAPPDTPQGVLARSHPGANIENLRTG